MNYTAFIQQLDHRPDTERLEIIINWLREHGVAFHRQDYRSGSNLFADLGYSPQRIGIASHFDKVGESGGANDNGSAIAVCLGIIERFLEEKADSPGLRIFFFDEEETGLKGSAAYIKQYGVAGLCGLVNMELVGMGDQLALWPLDRDYKGRLLETFEQAAGNARINALRFDKIVTNTADHVSFRNAGLADAFTVTCISGNDVRAAELYYQALQYGANMSTLQKILQQAPVFTHYHQPTDTWEKLNNSAMSAVVDVIWDTIQAFNTGLKK